MRAIIEDMIFRFRSLDFPEQLAVIIGYFFVLFIACPAMILFSVKILGCLFFGSCNFRGPEE